MQQIWPHTCKYYANDVTTEILMPWCEKLRKWVNWMLRWLGYFCLWIFKVKLYLSKATFTLCPSPCPSPCPYQSPCPNNSHFLIKLEAVFRLHQFSYQSPIQCHQSSVSIGPPTVKNWYGRPFPPNLASPDTKSHFDVWRGSCGHDIKSKTDRNSDSV